jgi:MFS family permease
VRLRLVFAAAIAFGTVEIAAGLVPSYLTFVLLCPLLGFSVITVLNSCNALLQVESDPLMRGRVMAIYMTIVMGGTPLGAPFIGWIGEELGARWTLVVGGGLVLAGVALAALVHVTARNTLDTGARPEPAILSP